MGEFIPTTPENETTPERFFWDNILRAVAELSDLDDELDAYETIEGLRNETEEDALMLVYNYAVMIEVPEGASSTLEGIEQLMRVYNLFEDEEGDSDEI